MNQDGKSLMIRNRLNGENRSEQQIREHYEAEQELANKLRKSTKAQRKSENLYATLYDELYRSVPHHQQLTVKASKYQTQRNINWQFGLIRRFINDTTIFLELGPGDCSFASKISGIVKKVYAIDVSEIITNSSSIPKYEIIISDGSSIPLPDDSIDVVYSNQLMEHIHPDDAIAQLHEIYRVLKSSGHYVCVTPNSVIGPWDISYYYNNVATGFHLKEYSVHELIETFRYAGFNTLKGYSGARGIYWRFPLFLIALLEKTLLLLPINLRVRLGRSLPLRMILGIKLVGTK